MAEPVSPNVLTEDQLARRQRIIDAGLSLLERNEYERIQIKDVAEEAGVALGTLYHYFSSKEHLFAEVLIKWAATLKASLVRHPPQGQTPREKPPTHSTVRSGPSSTSPNSLAIASLELSSDPFATEILERLDQTTKTRTWDCWGIWSLVGHARSSERWMPFLTASCVHGLPVDCRSRLCTTT